MELSQVRAVLTGCLAPGLVVSVLAAGCLGAAVNGPSSDRSATARAEAQAAHHALTAWLAETPHLHGWRSYLASGKLEEQLRRGAHADPAVVADMLRRYSGDNAGLEHRQFVAVRLALRNWLIALAPRTAIASRTAPPATGGHAVLRNAATSVLLVPSHGQPRSAIPAGTFSAADASQTPPLVAPVFEGMLPETSACVMVRHRFLAGIRGPALRHSANLRAPCAPTAAVPNEQGVSKGISMVEGISWHADYSAACREARRRQALLFISFHDPARPGREAAGAEELARLAAITRGYRYVFARFPLDYRTPDGGREVYLLQHPAFAELGGGPGIAIIDYENAAAEHYRHVVSQFPLRHGRPYSAWELATILDLPPGTLTQRTMIYAVRTHSHAPRSARGLPHHELLRESAWHSEHQASSNVQGHHNWEGRFHRINAKLGQMASREVVAESWGGQSLLEAAIECVHCWHQSSGHWDAVSSPHAEYGYDIERGSNGVWYATGLFGD